MPPNQPMPPWLQKMMWTNRWIAEEMELIPHSPANPILAKYDMEWWKETH